MCSWFVKIVKLMNIFTGRFIDCKNYLSHQKFQHLKNRFLPQYFEAFGGCVWGPFLCRFQSLSTDIQDPPTLHTYPYCTVYIQGQYLLGCKANNAETMSRQLFEKRFLDCTMLRVMPFKVYDMQLHNDGFWYGCITKARYSPYNISFQKKTKIQEKTKTVDFFADFHILL